MLQQFKKLIKTGGVRNRRNLISKNEGKVSFLQITGFILILLGILYFIGKFVYNVLLNFKSVPAINLTAEEVAILFFIIMLGVALAFPTLLEDQNKGLSTMRLVVFMMINVICMLLLKIGWNAKDLSAIGVNQYWMGIIAFVFGAKAVQTFFESRETSSILSPKEDAYNNTQPTINIKQRSIPTSGPISL